MTPLKRPLDGLRVGLSISDSEESVHRGFPAWQVNRVTLQVVAAFVGQGAGVVFGHDWRDDGVMEAVHGFACQVQSLDAVAPSAAAGTNPPLLENLLPWPDKPRLSPEDRELLASTLRVEEAGLPFELQVHVGRRQIVSGDDVYIRARGLTHLRHKLNERVHGRLCLGGRATGGQGRFPGVIEEALLSLRSNKPLYIAGILGGAALQLVEAFENRDFREDFCPQTAITGLYRDPPIREGDPSTQQDREIDSRAVWMEFSRAGILGLSRSNGLNQDENFELFHTSVIDRVIELMLGGLSRIAAR